MEYFDTAVLPCQTPAPPYAGIIRIRFQGRSFIYKLPLSKNAPPMLRSYCCIPCVFVKNKSVRL